MVVGAEKCKGVRAPFWPGPRPGSKGIKHGLHLHFPSLLVTNDEVKNKLIVYLRNNGHAAVDPKVSGFRMPLDHNCHHFASKLSTDYCSTCGKPHAKYTDESGITQRGAADDGRPYCLLARLDGNGVRDFGKEAEMFHCTAAATELEAPPPFTRSESIFALLSKCSLYTAISEADRAEALKPKIPASEPQRKRSGGAAAAKPGTGTTAAASAVASAGKASSRASGPTEDGSVRTDAAAVATPLRVLGPCIVSYLRRVSSELRVPFSADLSSGSRVSVNTEEMGDSQASGC